MMGKFLGTETESNRASNEAGLIVRDNGNTTSWRKAISGWITRYMHLALKVDEYILK
jgi:hypothetical protein